MNRQVVISSYVVDAKPWEHVDEVSGIQAKNFVLSGKGYLISHNNNLYALTCYYTIKNAYKLMMFVHSDREEIEMMVVSFSDELDLALLKPIHKTDICVSKDTNMSNILPHEGDTLYVYNNKKYITQASGIIFDVQQCFNMPEVPYINIISQDIPLTELTGSIVLNKNEKIVGIVSNIHNNVINIIPSISIHRFLTESYKHKHFYGLCGIIAKYDYCELSDTITGIYIQKTYGINYNLNKKKKRYNLKQHDVVCGVAGTMLDKDFCIYYDDVGYRVPLHTYIALNYMKDDVIPLTIYRKTMKNIKINARPVSTARYLPITYNKEYINYNGFILLELNEETLDMCRENGFIFPTILNEYMSNNPYRNLQHHIVALIDIIDKSKYIDLPFPVIEDNRVMLILSKINKKTVLGLNHAKKLLTELSPQSKISSTLCFTHDLINTNLKIKYNNKSIQKVLCDKNFL